MIELGTAAPERDTEVLDREDTRAGETAEAPGTLVETDLLVEDISIDGMCGVY